MFSKKNNSKNPQKLEKNEVIDFFTDPVYAYNSLYGIDQQEEISSLAPEEQKK